MLTPVGRPASRLAIRVGTRGSRLARAQTEWVVGRLRLLAPDVTFETEVIATAGDVSAAAPRGDGAFVKDIQHALLEGEIDLAVHSLKDLPTDAVAGLVVAAVPPRGDPRDAVVGGRLGALPPGARVGTGSPRRTAQVRRLRPDLQVVPLRGNVPTRVGRVRAGELDAVVLAAAGLERLGILADEVLALDLVLPAPGQGALAVEVREGGGLAVLVGGLDDPPTRAAVTAERAVLRALGGGCMLPVAAHARVEGGRLELEASVTSPDGTRQARAADDGDPGAPEEVAGRVARSLLEQGALELLAGG